MVSSQSISGKMILISRPNSYKMSENYFAPIETAPPTELRATLLERLNETLERAATTPFYEDRLPTTQLEDLSEMSRVPLTTKDELRATPIEQTMTTAVADVVEYHSSSGTTAEPYVMALTEADKRRTRETLARTWHMHGVRPSDTVQMMVSFGMFTAGHLNQYGIQEIGAAVAPVGIQSTREQFEDIQFWDPDYLVAVSDYYLRMIRKMDKQGYKLPDLKGVVGGGAPVSDQMHEYITEKLDAPFYNQYGLAEINTGIAGECSAHDGLHVQADYAYPEVVNPETGEPLPDGEEGELVLTTLGRHGQVHLRYRTNDITSITWDPCECGRTSPRIAPIRTRVDDIVHVHGSKLDTGFLMETLADLDTFVNPFRWQLRLEGSRGQDRSILFVDWKTDPDPRDLRDRLADHGIAIDQVEPYSEIADEAGDQKLSRIVDTRDEI